jgi:outer membrane biosynthesis protein TonB
MPNEQNNQEQKEVVDIFAGLDPVPSQSVKKPAAMPASALNNQPAISSQQLSATGTRSKLFIAGVIVLIVLAVIIVGLVVLKFVLGVNFGKIEFGAKEESAPVEKVEQPAAKPAPAPIVEPEPEPAPAVIELKPVDSDLDGLTDAEETNLGTNMLNADSDGDKLFDYDEVKTYGTDPLKADTDADGYLDGEEVLNGYNPKGPGKLLNFEKEKLPAQ